MSQGDKTPPSPLLSAPAPSPITATKPKLADITRCHSEPPPHKTRDDGLVEDVVQPMTPIDPDQTLADPVDPDSTAVDLAEQTSHMSLDHDPEDGSSQTTSAQQAHTGLPESSQSIHKKWKDAEACYREGWTPDSSDKASPEQLADRQDVCGGAAGHEMQEQSSIEAFDEPVKGQQQQEAKRDSDSDGDRSTHDQNDSRVKRAKRSISEGVHDAE